MNRQPKKSFQIREKISNSLKRYFSIPGMREKHSKIRKMYLSSEKGKGALAGANNPMYGKKHTEETRHKLSIARSNRCNVNTEGLKKYWKLKENRRKASQRRGEKSGRWKGGITLVSDLLRKKAKYKIWRQEVYERDNYTCQKCGKKGGDIQAHHKKKFSIILNDIKQEFPLFKLDDIADQYTHLWNIENGITLCKKCHKVEHGANKNERR